MIVEPAAQLGSKVTDSLVDWLLTEMAKRPDGLPLLQYHVMRAWHQAYATWTSDLPRPDLGDAYPNNDQAFDGVLERGAEAVLNEQLNGRQRRIAATIFNLLTERTIVRRVASSSVNFGEIRKKLTGMSLDEIAEVADAFRSPEIALLGPAAEFELADDVPIQISHECLARYWARLARWKDLEADVFLSYHSTDRSEVRKIAQRLKNSGLRVWFDDWNLFPGVLWMSEIEEQLQAVSTLAVFIGADGLGPWQAQEIQNGLINSSKRGCNVIPVMLGSTKVNADLPGFLGNHLAVDFRKNEEEEWKRLLAGITGVHDTGESQ